MHSNNTSQKEILTQLLYSKLNQYRTILTQSWQNPTHTRSHHFIPANLLRVDVCTNIYNALPKAADGFYNLNSFREKKRTSVRLENYPTILSDITYAFQHPKIV